MTKKPKGRQKQNSLPKRPTPGLLHMPMKSLTDEFVESYSDENYKGAFSRIVATGELPLGVDPNDLRVIDIIKKCKEAKEEK